MEKLILSGGCKKNIQLCSYIAIALFLLFIPCKYVKAASQDLYISPDGSDNNNGSIDFPFATFSAVIAKLLPGDTLYIMPGTYTQQIKLNNLSGEPNNPITIKPYQEKTVTIDGSSLHGSVLVELENCNYITIDGLILCNSKTNNAEVVPAGIFVYGDGAYIKLTNNTIYDIHAKGRSNGLNAHGIAIYGTNTTPITNLEISNNTIYNCTLGSSEALVVNGNVDNFSIKQNTVHDVDNIGIDCIGFEGIGPEDSDFARNGTITNNNVYNIDSSINPAYGGEGAADGIYVDGGQNITIDANTVNNCNIGIEVASEHAGKVTQNVRVTNNIVTNCDLYGLAIGGASTENGYAKNNCILNNTFYNNDVSVALQQCSNNTISSNIFYGGNNNLVIGDINSNILEYNIWYSKNDIFYEPFMSIADTAIFFDSSSEDFNLAQNSPALNTGQIYMPSPVTTDYYGNSRDGSVIDCGAIEQTDVNTTVSSKFHGILENIFKYIIKAIKVIKKY